MPIIEKLRAEFGDSVRFYGVNDETPSTVKKFLNEYHYEIPVLVDGKEDVRRRFGIRSIPTLLVIDRDGVVRQAFVDSRGESALRKSIQAALMPSRAQRLCNNKAGFPIVS